MIENGFNQNFMPKPDNHLALAIISTACCCLPFRIVSLVKSLEVNKLYGAGNYAAAVKASNDARKWAIISIAVGAAVNAIYACVNLCTDILSLWNA